ncbi:MAG: tetratricopeptide repeat protein [Actinobacteria bacterium]|nr:tetratricopeptide repeat protein [Actinomycetota bacterium]
MRLGTDAAPVGVAERLRTLRKHSGLTQTDLAGERFSKEYVSQIELGKTRPSAEAIEYLAQQLEVDPLFLETGVSSDERSRVEATLSRGEALIEDKKYAEAVEEYVKARALVTDDVVLELELRALSGEAWARMQTGELKPAMELLTQARDLAERPRFSDLDRADVLFRMGVCRYKLTSLQTAISLFTEALALTKKSDLPCDRLRADIYRWRSRCYRRQRDWEAAREDVELALELAEGVGDPREIANTYFQASLIAERNGHWVLARSYAERAKNEYERLADKVNYGRLLNNLGAFNFMLGKPEEAERLLKDAFRVALDTDNEIDAAYAIGSLAKVHLETGRPEQGEEQARKALDLLGGREDCLDEIGNAQLVLGRSLLARERLAESDEWLRAAERSFEQIESPGHRSAALVARGDLAAREGKDADAARLYRKAAELLQDVRF